MIDIIIYLRLDGSADSNGNYLKFNIDDGTTSDGTSHSSTMIIGAGNVGIGESTPTARLHVKIVMTCLQVILWT